MGANQQGHGKSQTSLERARLRVESPLCVSRSQANSDLSWYLQEHNEWEPLVLCCKGLTEPLLREASLNTLEPKQLRFLGKVAAL